MQGSLRIMTPRMFGRAGLYVLLVCVLGLILFPIYWMLITSFKPPSEAFRLPPTLWPEAFSGEAYPYVVQAWEYWPTLLNTLIVAGFSGLGATLLGGLAAYGFSRMQFPGKSVFFGFIVISMALPGMVTIGPIFLAYTQLNLLDTLQGLILVNVSGGIPLALLTLYTYLNAIPRELDEAAAIDGCSRAMIIFKVIGPLAAPGLMVSALLIFIAVWNEFLYAFTLTVTPASRLLNVRLMEVPVREGVQTIPYDLIAAGGMLCLLPLLPILIGARRQLVDGLLAGSLKG
jgi:ABC-type glycerol-3-phosphate transport system permease component